MSLLHHMLLSLRNLEQLTLVDAFVSSSNTNCPGPFSGGDC